MTRSAEKVAGPRSGSSAAYALLFAPARQQAGLRALYAIRREIDETLFMVEDPGVARLKRAWWSEEIGRLGQGSPRHPATVSLHPAAVDLIDCLRRFLGAADSWRVPGAPGDAFRTFCGETGGSLARATGELDGSAAGKGPREGRSAARDLGTAIRSTALLRFCRVAPGVRSMLFGHGEDRDGEQALARWTAETFERGLDNMPAAGRGHYRAVLVMARLYRRLLDRLRSSRPGTYVELGTPAKLWIAWSAAMSAGRLRRGQTRDETHVS